MAKQGLRKPLESPKRAKISKKNLCLTFLKVSPETKSVPYFFKAKNKEKLFFYYFLGQNPFLPFLKIKKNSKQPLILKSIFGNWSLM